MLVPIMGRLTRAVWLALSLQSKGVWQVGSCE